MIVVDSSVWIANMRNDLTPQVRLLREIDHDEVIVGDIVVLEVLRGMRGDREAAIQEQRFRVQGITPMLSPARAALAAAHFRRLRSLGITIRTAIDLVIATYCIEKGHDLLHQDRDFDHFERHLGLRVAR